MPGNSTKILQDIWHQFETKMMKGWLDLASYQVTLKGLVGFENYFNGTTFYHHFCVKTGPEDFLGHFLTTETYSESSIFMRTNSSLLSFNTKSCCIKFVAVLAPYIFDIKYGIIIKYQTAMKIDMKIAQSINIQTHGFFALWHLCKYRTRDIPENQVTDIFGERTS